MTIYLNDIYKLPVYLQILSFPMVWKSFLLRGAACSSMSTGSIWHFRWVFLSFSHRMFLSPHAFFFVLVLIIFIFHFPKFFDISILFLFLGYTRFLFSWQFYLSIVQIFFLLLLKSSTLSNCYAFENSSTIF